MPTSHATFGEETYRCSDGEREREKDKSGQQNVTMFDNNGEKYDSTYLARGFTLIGAGNERPLCVVSCLKTLAVDNVRPNILKIRFEPSTNKQDKQAITRKRC